MLTIDVDAELQTKKPYEPFSFAGHNRTIRFGRSKDSDIDVRFPDGEDSELGRMHFELRPTSSSYEIATDREHKVFVNGKQIIGTMALLLDATTEIRLIDAKTGPSIRVTVTQERSGNVTKKTGQGDSGTLQDLIWSTQGRTRTLGWGLGVVAVAALVGGGWLWNESWQQQKLLASFMDDTQKLITKLDEKPAAIVPANWEKIYTKVKPSVYQVAIKKNDGSAPEPQATAWVFGPHTLVTNSHAAALYRGLGRNESLVVIAPDGMQSMVRVIAEPKLHPAYERFRQIVEQTEKSSKTKIGQVGSYDVAFLEVDNSVQLGPKLEIERKLSIGQPIGFLGYPSAFARNDAAGQFRIGYVSGTTDFLGVAQNTNGELIYHNADGAGGASGSPIFNDKGDVVAIFSGGETRKVGASNIISGAGTFYAQSVVLLDDLTTGWSDGKMKSAVAAWTSEALYLSKKDTVWAMLQEFGNVERLDKKEFPPAFEKEVTLSKDGSAQIAAKNLVPGTYVAFVSSTDKGDRKPLRLRVMVEGSAIQSPLYINSTPTAIFKSGEGQASFVLSGAADTKYWLQLHRFDEKGVVVSDAK